MKLTVQQAGRQFSIPLPLSLMCSPPVLCCVSKFRISWRAAAKLSREVGRLRREHPQWVLMEVETSDGTRVTMRL